MTSPTIPETVQQDLEGRSVRDVVEYSPGQVSDAWCRKVLRKILQSLELQYAMEMPHRAITPDTVVFHANGEPLLISDNIDAAPAPDAHLPDDLTALARVIHYAITHELAPAGPLAGRVDGYSAALVATVDACMDPDPARRPHSIDAMLGLLGIVAPGPLPGAVTLPEVRKTIELNHDAAIMAGASGAGMAAHSSIPADIGSVRTAAGDSVAASLSVAAPDKAVEAHRAGMQRGKRWPIAAGAIAIAFALVWLVEWRDGGSSSHTVLAQPPTGAGVRPGMPAPVSAPSAGTVAMGARRDQAASGAPANPAGAPVSAATRDADGGPAANVAGGLPAKPASDPVGSPASGASSAGTTGAGGDADQLEDISRVAPSPASAADRVVATVKPAVPARAAATPPGAVPGTASYQLQIKPWGVVYVDGVDRGVSPPLKRLTLTPGRHTIRITNPDYRDSNLEFESAQTTSNGKIIVDFNHEAQ
jgi:hypothetical protein